MGIETKGIIHTIYETKHVSDKFTKREFVVETSDNPKYPQFILFQITGDKVSQLDGLNAGDEVRVDFQVRGREWRSPSGDVKYFNSLDCWKVERVGEQRTGGSGGRSQTSTTGSDDDSIPF